MLSSLKEISTYDVFGYLIPGFVFLLTGVLLLWVLVCPATPLIQVIDPSMSLEGWTLLVLTAYLAGHLAQAVGNLALRGTAPAIDDKEVLSSATIVLEKMGLKYQKRQLGEEQILDICDQFVIHAGGEYATNTRDIYIYREGFYRGMVISSGALLLVLLFIGLSVTDTMKLVLTPSWDANRVMVLFSYALVAVSVWCFYNRLERFRGYRYYHSIAGFVVLTKLKSFEPNDATASKS